MFGVNLSFAQWWIANDIGFARGKAYGGVRPAADTTELGFCSALVSQAVAERGVCRSCSHGGTIVGRTSGSGSL